MTTPYPTVNALLSHSLPRHLFHYTNAAGLEGIFRTKSIRATEAGYLNDEKEILHAKDCIQSSIENMMRHGELLTSDSGDSFLHMLEQKSYHVRTGVFVASFSEQRDQLSQWRAYAGGQDGYSIGFPAGKLKKCAEAAGFSLSKCTYDYQTQYKIADEVVRYFVSIFEKSDRSREKAEIITNRLPIEITKLGPLFKHKAFSEENEWRIFSPQISINDARIEFKISNNRLAPYVKIDFCDDIANTDGDPHDTMVVVAGPSPHYSANAYAMQALIHKYFGMGVGMGRSDAPFRTGN